MEAIQQFWSQFLQFEFASEVLILLGALLVLIGVVKIVRSSIKMLFWVILSGLGAMSVAYGMNDSSLLPGNGEGVEITDLIGQGKDLSMDVRELLCNRWLGGDSE